MNMRLLVIQHEEGLKSLRKMLKDTETILSQLENIRQDKKRTRAERKDAAKKILMYQADKSTINGMISEMMDKIEHMRTGRNPNSYNGVEHRKSYEHKSFSPDYFDTIPMTEVSYDEGDRDSKEEFIDYLLSDLTEKEKDTFLLVKYGYTQEDAAELLGVSKKTVWTRMKSAEKKIEIKAGIKLSTD
ncbi:DUF134 domain-containing protein (plasmid) [Rossellomorea vietnamensis]|uniref:DUF134 domain-containing protein n=1 Tax=Rossellomorea vietnamensis TaxID=218284 RepID=A0A6I6ULT5_9BACI|nr:sigma factor-like helix-turn-helix DNA-binding protein [Rossellomorea vietnamensis]QHE63975.1 DUF134 domain-containing protein [Rossellomorea vietnamensis]